ncbi:MAG: DUF692 domain-containing protein [Pseudobdellovibrionaceae bacterium]|nr:DUF692 domain-containing protein [Pseudobdellovibrionaceae bacterium]
MAGDAVTGQRIARDALGLGLRPALYTRILAERPLVDYFEIISENFMGPAKPPRQNLAQVRAHYPVVMHGVGLNLLGHEPLNEHYLEALCRLADIVDPPFVSDHLCWTGAHGFSHHDLLPTPYTRDLVGYAADRARRVQERLGRPFALENLSSYVRFAGSEMTEWEFYRAVVDEAGVYFMLDINNIYVSSQNHQFNPLEYLQYIPFDRVVQVHLAGHNRRPDGTIIDTHDRAVDANVWDLYRKAWALGGPFPTLLEWDDDLPPMPELVAEMQKAREFQS